MRRPDLRSPLPLAPHTRLAWTIFSLVDGEFSHVQNGDFNTGFGDL